MPGRRRRDRALLSLSRSCSRGAPRAAALPAGGGTGSKGSERLAVLARQVGLAGRLAAPALRPLSLSPSLSLPSQPRFSPARRARSRAAGAAAGARAERLVACCELELTEPSPSRHGGALRHCGPHGVPRKSGPDPASPRAPAAGRRGTRMDRLPSSVSVDICTSTRARPPLQPAPSRSRLAAAGSACAARQRAASTSHDLPMLYEWLPRRRPTARRA
jgi:hypothetical protein